MISKRFLIYTLISSKDSQVPILTFFARQLMKNTLITSLVNQSFSKGIHAHTIICNSIILPRDYFLRSETLLKIRDVDTILKFIRYNILFFNRKQEIKISRWMKEHSKYLIKSASKREVQLTLFYLLYVKNIVRISHAKLSCVKEMISYYIRNFFLTKYQNKTVNI